MDKSYSTGECYYSPRYTAGSVLNELRDRLQRRS
jgi:hypothetical protein